MTSVAIFTPSHDSKYLKPLYDSLLAQTDQDFHWTILLNNGGEPLDEAANDKRVTQHLLYKAPEWVGALKAYACKKAQGDILMEVDHDDLLAPDAVAECKRAFAEHPDVGFVYSNALHVDAELNSHSNRYADVFGWRNRDTEHQGRTLYEPISFDATPAALSRIWYAPNHFRAFRRDVYEKVGGYAVDMRVLDDQDLMCRLYCETKFHHIDRGLYIYRIHGENSWLKHNAEIQANTERIGDKYASKMVKVWAEREGLRCIDLGGRFAKQDGYESVDVKDADVNCDLEQRWPFEDSSVGVIRAVDIFEHLRDPLHTMRECYRVLAPGGWIFARVPSTDGRGAFQDPTHRSFWNQNSWLYYSHKNWAQYIDTPVRFKAVRRYTTEKDANEVCWTIAHLISLKDGYRPPGLIEI